ncbi:MAG: hypothetical protein NC899_04735 [Candidatus Omnitrophica bacterium]|nr:hypothetical protein [Candidatus Omnitrophota bacterium]
MEGKNLLAGCVPDTFLLAGIQNYLTALINLIGKLKIKTDYVANLT